MSEAIYTLLFLSMGIGLLCLVFDLLYIYFLRIVKLKEIAAAA